MVVAAGLGALVGGVWWWAPTAPPSTRNLVVPPLSQTAESGREAYARSCAGCHGDSGAGGPAGPPLVHRIYHPGHHSDSAFELAVRRGVRAHHWRFGDMPPRPEVSATEVEAITRYIRELQRANGIG